MTDKIIDYISKWEKRCYTEGLPDESPEDIFEKVPSYQRIAIAILKNDYSLSSLGYTPKKSAYYNSLKRIEIESRGKLIEANFHIKPIQLCLY